MPLAPGNDLDFGPLPGGNGNLKFSRKDRDKHLYICGGTGTGKSKLLEHLIRQDIKQWHKSKCGLILLDPHGNLYDNLMKWLAWNADILDVPVIPIDLRRDDWIVSYNLLRQRKTAAQSVVVDSITKAMAHVWGQEGTKGTPQFARWIGNVIDPLYEKQLTLIEAEFLMDRVARHIRHAITSDLKNGSSKQDWQFVETLSPLQFDTMISSTINRMRAFIKNQIFRSMFGQPTASLDLGTALEEGSIILVSLATAGGRVSEDDANLFGTLLLSDLWTAAKERGKYDGVKPFYVYLDEFQKFVTPTISENLDQARGFGLHLTLAHQFPLQLPDQGEHGRRVLNSVLENASSKIAFRLRAPENLQMIAQILYMGVMNPEEIKHVTMATRVVGHREEMKEVIGESISEQRGGGRQIGRASGRGTGGTANYEGDDTTGEPLSSSVSDSAFDSGSHSENESWSETKTLSKSLVPTLVPIMGQEVAHVQFRSLDEQLWRAMAALSDQEERQGVARLIGMKAPVSIFTPTVQDAPSSEERVKRCADLLYSKLPFALPGPIAQKQVEDRAKRVKESLLQEMEGEERSNRRRVR